MLIYLEDGEETLEDRSLFRRIGPRNRWHGIIERYALFMSAQTRFCPLVSTLPLLRATPPNRCSEELCCWMPQAMQALTPVIGPSAPDSNGLLAPTQE